MPHHDQGPGSSVPIDGLNRGVQSRKRAPFWGRFEGRFEPQASGLIDHRRSKTTRVDVQVERHIQRAAIGNTN